MMGPEIIPITILAIVFVIVLKEKLEKKLEEKPKPKCPPVTAKGIRNGRTIGPPHFSKYGWSGEVKKESANQSIAPASSPDRGNIEIQDHSPRPEIR